MESLVLDLALYRLSNAVLSCLEELEKPNSLAKTNDLELRFQELLRQGEITKEEYIYVHTRILLNKFCYKIEERIGRGAMAGFLFYSRDHHALYFGAGANYPPELKAFIHGHPPTVDLKYGENSIFYGKKGWRVIPSLEHWEDEHDKYNFKAVFEKTNVKSLFSKRLFLNGFVFGTFECYFPHKGGPTQEEVDLILSEVQPIKEELYHLRCEMLEVLGRTKKAISH